MVVDGQARYNRIASNALLTVAPLPKVGLISKLRGLRGAKSTGLSKSIAKTFRRGRYKKIILDKPTVLSRYYDNVDAFAKGRYMTNPSSLSGSRFLNRQGLALRPRWNKMTKLAHWQLQPGTVIYKGRAATQFPWLGGKTQYFLPDLSRMK